MRLFLGSATQSGSGVPPLKPWNEQSRDGSATLGSGSAVVSTAPVGVPPAESFRRKGFTCGCSHRRIPNVFEFGNSPAIYGWEIAHENKIKSCRDERK
jgi:hypothetical protein